MFCFTIRDVLWLMSVLAVAVCPPNKAQAQPLFYSVQSLEWMVADSPVIIRATIVDSARETDNRETWDTVVVKVVETLKGPHKPFHVFVIANWNYKDDLPRWKRTNQELLIFLIDREHREIASATQWREKFAPYELTPRYMSSHGQALIELGPPLKTAAQLKSVYTLDLKDLNEPEEILQYTQSALAASQGQDRPLAHKVRWPKGAGPNIDRVVPIDARLEREARKWIKSEDARIREEGAKALAHFPSDENIAALKGLLDDPGFVNLFRQEGLEVIQTGREYPVRRAAVEALKKLNIPVNEGVLQEPFVEKR